MIGYLIERKGKGIALSLDCNSAERRIK